MFHSPESVDYATNWDPETQGVIRYEVGADGRLSKGIAFFDMTIANGEEALDGIEIDEAGHLFVPRRHLDPRRLRKASPHRADAAASRELRLGRRRRAKPPPHRAIDALSASPERAGSKGFFAYAPIL